MGVALLVLTPLGHPPGTTRRGREGREQLKLKGAMSAEKENLRGMEPFKGPLTPMESRMPFYAGLMRSGKPAMSPRLLERWRRALPAWITQEYQRIDRGEMPTLATIEAVIGHD